MPPTRSRKGAPPSNNSTLGRFFAIRTAKPQPAVRTQPKLTTMLRRAARQRGDDAMDTDPPDEREPDHAADAASISSSESVGGTGISDLSDSDSDGGLVDATSILGTAGPSVTPGYGLRSRLPALTASTSTTTSTVSTPRATPYRNSLKSLVRESRKQKYDLEFLEKRVLLASVDSTDPDSSADSGSDVERPTAPSAGGSTAVDSVLGALSPRDSRAVRAQLAADSGIQGRTMQLSLFLYSERRGSPGQPQCGPKHFRGQQLSDDDLVDRMCMARADDAGFARALLESQLLVARAHRGWRLTQGIGDGLLQAVCLDADDDIAADAHETLCRLVDMGQSSWVLHASRLLELLETLLGPLRDRVEDTSNLADSRGGNDTDTDDGNGSLSDSPSVVVEIVRPRCAGAARTSAQRATLLIDIASRAFGFDTVKGSCDVLVMAIAMLLDRGNGAQLLCIQRALVRAVERVSAPSTWALVWPACVAWLGPRLSCLRLPALLYVVDSLPTATQRCMQLRRSLSFMLLRMQAPEYAMGEQSVDKLAVAVTLPRQTMLRMVSEMMDPDNELFCVGRDADFTRLGAAVGLLSNFLDCDQAMRDEIDTIHRRLSAMSRRINDGMATRFDKTLAKDAIQTLLVRISMTAMSARSTRAPASRTLDGWLSDT